MKRHTQLVWETIGLQEGFNLPFLMHGILAISALHLSHLSEDGRYGRWLDVAIVYKNTALTMNS